MAWKILFVSILSFSLVGCNHGRLVAGREIDKGACFREDRKVDLQFEVSYEQDGARVAIKGRI